jgi:hypothetical protein
METEVEKQAGTRKETEDSQKEYDELLSLTKVRFPTVYST